MLSLWLGRAAFIAQRRGPIHMSLPDDSPGLSPPRPKTTAAFNGVRRLSLAHPSSSLSAEYQTLQALYAKITAPHDITYDNGPGSDSDDRDDDPGTPPTSLVLHGIDLTLLQDALACRCTTSRHNNVCRRANMSMFTSYRIPYPSHKSPLEDDSANRDGDWAIASQTDPSFVHPVGTAGITRSGKLALLQNHFWPALARWVDERSQVLPGGTVVGGWWRADIVGMMDWYRDCFGMTSRWEDAGVAHADGIWRDVLATSPWRDWPEFFGLLKEPVLTRDGKFITDGKGGTMYRDKDPRTAGLEDAFVDLWEAIANTRPLKMPSSRPRAAM